MRFSDAVDVAGIAAVSAGLGVRFGWWLAAVAAGLLSIVASNIIGSDE